jgi:hypothetical protein
MTGSFQDFWLPRLARVPDDPDTYELFDAPDRSDKMIIFNKTKEKKGDPTKDKIMASYAKYMSAMTLSAWLDDESRKILIPSIVKAQNDAVRAGIN